MESCCGSRNDDRGQKKLDNILDKCIETNQKFKDKEFPPEKSSLITDWNEDNDEVREAKGEDWDSIEWKRAEDIEEFNDAAEGQLELFKKGIDGTGAEGIEPNDIQQRGLGDCYFLCVLSALAEKPERIRSLFINTEYNKWGVYGCQLTKNGASVQVFVDNYVPCRVN